MMNLLTTVATSGNELPRLVESLGFPIVACVAMFWKMNDQDKKHAEEMEKVRKAVDNNTVAIIKLVDKLGG